jgi:hypothetical protein
MPGVTITRLKVAGVLQPHHHRCRWRFQFPKPAHRAPVHRWICWVCEATGCLGCSLASSPRSAKAARPGLRTWWPGWAVERRWWKKGSDAEESGEAGTVQHRRRTPRGGVRGGVLDPATVEPSTLVSSRASGSAMRARWCADRVNPTAPPSPFYTPSSNPSSRRPHRPLVPPAGPTGLGCMPLRAEPILAHYYYSLLFMLYLVCSLNLV